MESTGNSLQAHIEALDAISEAIHSEFQGPGAAARLEQFDAHLATVKMVAGTLYEESERMTVNGRDNYREAQ